MRSRAEAESPPADPAGPADPLPAIVVAFTLGALALLRCPAVPAWPWLLALPPVLRLPGRLRLPLLAAALGAVLTLWHVQSGLADRWPVAHTGAQLPVRGTIGDLPEGRPASGDGGAGMTTWRFRFDPDDPSLPRHLRVSWYRSAAQLRGGQCWQLQLRLRSPHGSRDPGGFDYEGWLFREDLGATATVIDGTPCGAGPGHRLLRLRQALADRFARWLPGHPGLPLVAALTLGDTTGLDDVDWQRFRITGTTHLIAISGFNVAIVAGAAFFLLRWLWSASARLCLLWPAQRAAWVGSAVVATLYALLAGFDPPVERAAVMLLALLAAVLLGGRGSSLRALMLAWLVIVAVDPLTLLTPGLWLSFGAVAAIFYASGGRLAHAPAWREAVRLQWMLSLVLAPLTLFWFQGTSLLGPWINLLAVPVVAVLTPALLAALMLAAAWPALGIPALRAVADALVLGNEGLAWLAEQLPQGWLAASPAPAALLLGLGGAVLLFAPAGLPLRLLGALAFSALLLPVERAPKADFELTVLDVGQGLAVVVRTARHTLLFDAGPASPEGFDAGRAVVVPWLLHEGVRRIDRLIISHHDLDHRGGAPAVRAGITVVDEWGSESAQPCREGQAWDWDGVHFAMLNGPAAVSGSDRRENDLGCVLRVSSPHLSALLPADVEAPVEARLVADYGVRLRSDVLVAPHHGSHTSSSPAFLDAVGPRLVIYSAGWHHRFHHPAPEVVARCTARGIDQMDTADSGAIRIAAGERGLQIRQWRVVAARLWSAPRDQAWRQAATSKVGPGASP